MCREIWDHFAHPVIGVAGAGTTTLVAQSDTGVPYHQWDIWIDSMYQWDFAGELTWYKWGDTTAPMRRHVVISGQNNQPRALRFSSEQPVQDIVCTGTFTNRNATNAIQVTMHLNTMHLRKVR